MNAKTTSAKNETPTQEALEFGRFLRDLRKKQGLNQAELAAQVSLTSGYYGFFEQARQVPSLKIINRLAEVLDTDYMEMAKKAGYDELEALKKKAGATARVSGRTNDSASAGTSHATPGDEHPSAVKPQSAHLDSPAGNRESVTEISWDRLEWAIRCIAEDPSYKLADQFRSGTLPDAVKALVIQLYQSQTGRNLLTPDESLALNNLVHGT